MLKFSDYLITEAKVSDSNLSKTISYLEKEKQVLLITTSNRPEHNKDDIPKSTQLARFVQSRVGANKCEIIDAASLNILPCVGNVSSSEGNTCGLKGALLKDKEKNPSGYHRCWVSFSNEKDELWKISKSLFDSTAVIFFGPIRWGQMNGIYQKLIERLNWIENRRTSLQEGNIVKDIKAGIITIGHNWRGKEVVDMQKEVYKFFGFKVPDEISWHWQYTSNENLESLESYKQDIKAFEKIFDLKY
jgi:multimeric flavodoxin WrbA